MFGHESQPSVIYRYGASCPTENAGHVREQILLAHRYWNTLTEIERRRRDRTDEAVRQASPELAGVETRCGELDEQLQAARAEVKRRNALERRKRATPEEQAAIRELRDALKVERARRKELRSVLFADGSPAKQALEQVETLANAERKLARAESGLYWGTYLAVEQAAQSMRKGAPPEFRRIGVRGDFPEYGRVALQIQKGITVSEALRGDDQRLRIEPTEDGTGYTTVRMRVGSDGRDPLWATFGVKFHRPLPDDARIKWVYLHREMVADHETWTVSFVIARKSGWSKPDTARSGSVGVDLGWRLVPGGLRVAYWIGDDGDEGELILPSRDTTRWAKAESLRSIRDREFNEIQPVVVEWLKNRESTWLHEHTPNLHLWRSSQKLELVVERWRSNRFDGDEEIFARCEAWRKQSKHLREWEVNQRKKATNWREDTYRKFAAMLRRKYRVVCVEKFSVAEMAKLPVAESNENDRAMRVYRRIASPGRLRELLTETAASVVRVDAKHTTMQCHACGELSGEPNPEMLIHTCSQCGESWDQDRNAAINLLSAASGEVTRETAGTLA